MLEPEDCLRQYRVIRILGEGGFATTYLAEDKDLKKYFAIKEYGPKDFSKSIGQSIVPRERYENDFNWGRSRFLEEARLLAKFTHPNIVNVSQVFEENNTAYMVLDYQKGMPLHDWRNRHSDELTQSRIDAVIAPLLDALDKLHQNNILHRDIAPDNIFIRDDGTPVLLDFGSAREAFSLKTQTVSAVVKDGFSPIEQYSRKNDSQGPWTDIYSLAATIYWLISKKAPSPSVERLVSDDLIPITGNFRTSFIAAVYWGLKVLPKDRPDSIKKWRQSINGETIIDTTDKTSIERQIVPKTINKKYKFLFIAAGLCTLIIPPFFLEKPIKTIENPGIPENTSIQNSEPSSAENINPTKHRAALLLDAPDLPEKVKTFVGNVVWRLEDISRGSGQPIMLGVRAEIDLPYAKLKAVMLIQKNTDETLPASHTIELRFFPTEGGAVPGIAQIQTPQMRREDVAKGDALIGVPTPILRNYFLIGLTRGATAESRNVDLIRNRGWFDVPLLLSDQRIAKITFEIGSSGERMINDAIKSWSAVGRSSRPAP